MIGINKQRECVQKENYIFKNNIRESKDDIFDNILFFALKIILEFWRIVSLIKM